MCGRYILRMQKTSLDEWEKYGPPPFLESYNVAPTQQVAILRSRAGTAEWAMVCWGLVPYFTRGAPPKYSTINARIACLNSYYRFLIRMDLVKSNPCERLERPHATARFD
jgi:putative SOS response-associated peptidase YedK